ncbi:MAG: ribosome-binding factor A [Gammaproteobacteria bacterium]|nr:ribosome-binding factor A [Gammaproteobacteria bacterium]
MAKENGRAKKIGELVQKELAQLLQRELRDPRLGMITINEVTVSKDYSFSDIYFTVLPEESAFEAEFVLNEAGGFLRTRLASMLGLRITPKLRFHYDNSLENGARINDLISEDISKSRNPEMKRDI